MVPRIDRRGPEQRHHHRLHDKLDRKSTRLNSSHRTISYAVFCFKKEMRRGASEAWLVRRPKVRIERDTLPSARLAQFGTPREASSPAPRQVGHKPSLPCRPGYAE